ncbi:hypothetical protein BC827DRAFT_1385887 [Russula dissimulans]|nr:hypothetical protein BC827DRAFT_1385887 [Russula dissimulans]
MDVRDEYIDAEPHEKATFSSRWSATRSSCMMMVRPATGTTERIHNVTFQWLTSRRGPKAEPRTVPSRPPVSSKYRAQPKYNVFAFLQIMFYEQFKLFFNLCFLPISLSRFVPALGTDDDDSSHGLLEDSLPPTRAVPSCSIRVGDPVLFEKNRRVSADLVLLRTDQLDGETDWKLPVAVLATQKLPSDQELLNLDAEVHHTSTRLTSPTFSAHTQVSAADARMKDIHSFIGAFTINTPSRVSLNEVPIVQVSTVEPLSVEVLWENTVLAEGSAIEFVDYTAPEARGVMNTSHSETKVGLLDSEIRCDAATLLGLSSGGEC